MEKINTIGKYSIRNGKDTQTKSQFIAVLAKKKNF
jgi:hypothetical protein